MLHGPTRSGPRKASDQALRKAKSRAVSSIDKTISSLGGEEVQAQALHDYCELHPAGWAGGHKAAGFFPSEEVMVAMTDVCGGAAQQDVRGIGFPNAFTAAVKAETEV